MRIPVPSKILIAFSLAGVPLTAIVAGDLAAPIDSPTEWKQTDQSEPTASDASQQVATDSPAPNKDFTPAGQTQAGYEDEEHGEYEERDEEYEEEE